MIWNASEVSKILGVEPCLIEGDSKDDEGYLYDIAGPRLKYTLIIQPNMDHVAVSGDPERPFGAYPFYEVCVPCGSIWMIVDCSRHPPDTKPEAATFFALVFCLGPEKRLDRYSLMLKRRPDGDLSICPVYPYPKSHPYFRG